jgi:hypothetical protein
MKTNNLEQIIYEATQRINWFVQGIGIHGLPPELFSKLPTERIVELYNVEMSYFIK